MTGLAQLQLFNECDMPREIISQHHDRSAPPAIYIYGLRGHELGGWGLLQSKGRVFLGPDVFPSYFNHWLGKESHRLGEHWGGSLLLQDASIIEVDTPVASVIHPNLVYGHFLLEMFPRLYLLSKLRTLGVPFILALPNRIAKWVTAIIGLYFSDDEILYYDPLTTRVRSPCFILPSMMHANYKFHPDFNVAIEELKRHVLPQKRRNACDRIWISRRRHSGRSWLRNEEEVESTMISLGFEVIHPQELTFPQQVQTFDAAKAVVSEYGSAVHNTLFSPRGARVFCLNRINWYQSGIGCLREQPMAYMMPSDGRFRDWRVQGTPDAAFEINCATLRNDIGSFLAWNRPEDGT
jgi:O-antigen biosynthesis protein WbqL